MTGSQPQQGNEDEGKTSVEFTEEMKGYVDFGETDYETGFLEGKRKGKQNFFMFHLTIKTDDIDAFVADPMQEASAEGYVQCEALGGELPVEKGIFNLLVDVADGSEKRMFYRLFFRDDSGNPLTLSGFKEVKDDPGLDLWADTTTLFTKIYQGHLSREAEADDKLSASGKIQIYFHDFLKQMTTFRAKGGGISDKADAMAKFGALFMGKLWEAYGSGLPMA